MFGEMLTSMDEKTVIKINMLTKLSMCKVILGRYECWWKSLLKYWWVHHNNSECNWNKAIFNVKPQQLIFSMLSLSCENKDLVKTDKAGLNLRGSMKDTILPFLETVIGELTMIAIRPWVHSSVVITLSCIEINVFFL